MTSSISSSKPRPWPLSPRVNAAVFLACIATLLIGSRAARAVNWWTDDHVAPSIAVIPQSPDRYLAYYHFGLEHFIFWNGQKGIPAELKKADVLLLGTSHMQFDWPRETAEPFFAGRGLRYYNMGFGYSEGCQFPLALIRKFDLHPRLVVINVDPFFYLIFGGMSQMAMRENSFDAFKTLFEWRSTFYAQRYLHRIVPPLDDQMPSFDEIYYRSIADGSVDLAESSDYHVPVPDQTPPDKHLWEPMMPAAVGFKAEMDRRHIRMVLTVDPIVNPAAAEGFAAALGVPLVRPGHLPGLYTFDYSHLEKPSAIRFSSAFYELLKTYLDHHPLGTN